VFFDYCRENKLMSKERWLSFIKEMGQCIDTVLFANS
jgi:hypothetical protein